MKKFTDTIKEFVQVFDGSKGYMLQQEGLSGGESAEAWNITKRDTLTALYQKYKNAGSDVIQTNTFQGTEHHLKQHGFSGKVYEVNYTAAIAAKKVMGQEGYVAASVGPIGRMMTPSGDLTFDQAYQLYKEQMIPLIEGGVDAVNFETFTDVAELRAAVLALKDLKKDMPVIASVAFEENKRTLMGTSPYNVALILKSLGCEVIGTNCSFGPEHMLDIIKEMSCVGGPLSVKPNAGIPRLEQNHAVYDQSPADFARACEDFLPYGAVLIGGCCGTTPLFVSELKSRLNDVKPVIREYRETGEISSLNFVVKINEYDTCNRVVLDMDDPNTRRIINNEDLLDLMTLAMDAKDLEPDVIVLQGGADLDPGKVCRCFDIIQGYSNKPFVFHVNKKDILEPLLRIYRGRGGVLTDNQHDLIEVAGKYGAFVIE
ncbi:MAG TPA: homocysteine methyltransferase [Clostridiales bacterium]|nr:homocysteine methyltransferase [Clostridiales bacterium]